MNKSNFVIKFLFIILFPVIDVTLIVKVISTNYIMRKYFNLMRFKIVMKLKSDISSINVKYFISRQMRFKIVRKL